MGRVSQCSSCFTVNVVMAHTSLSIDTGQGRPKKKLTGQDVASTRGRLVGVTAGTLALD